MFERGGITVLEHRVKLVQATWVLCLPEDNRFRTLGDLGGRDGHFRSWVIEITPMPRQLRSRQSRPNYASLHTGGEVEVYVPDPEDLESGSDFAANGSGVDGDAEPDAEGFQAGGELDDEEGPSPKATPQVKKAKSKSQGPSTRPRRSVPVGLSKPSKSAPPTTHHRHRPPPLFRRDAQVERLLDPPALFQPPATVLTNSFTSSARTTKRLERSWSRNVGPGPVHELLEDRAWFKEAIPDAAVTSEAGRRPVVYHTVKLDGKYQVISERSVLCRVIPLHWY